MNDFLIKRYSVYISGFPNTIEYAESRHKAFMNTFWSYTSSHDVSLKEFMRDIKPNIYKLDEINNGIFGTAIEVNNKKAYMIKRQGNQVYFVRPNKTMISISHELDTNLKIND